MKVITRFAPSPTGYLHAGSYRTALFAWLFARQNEGKFILRIEDTDRERSKKEFEDNILDSLAWLGLNYDDTYRQSERADLYKGYIEKLIASGHAYVSDKEEVGKSSVIRFKNPNKTISFDDLIRGTITFDTTELGDFVIAKSLEEPIFHLANVVDDHESGVTHVIRGEDHISNTQRHILIFEAIGGKAPIFAHIPLLLAKDRSKLSKRNGALAVTDYRGRGYLPAALVNYFVLLGWHPEGEKEIFSLAEILKEFSLDRVQKGGAIFDDEKLSWFNREYIKKLDDVEFMKEAQNFWPKDLSLSDSLEKSLLPLLRDKISSFSDITQLFDVGGELAFVKGLPDYNKDMLHWKKDPDPAKTLQHLEKSREVLNALSEDDFTAPVTKGSLWSYAEEHGKGNVLWPLRVALTGQEKSPDPFTSAVILGKKESLNRINKACESLK